MANQGDAAAAPGEAEADSSTAPVAPGSEADASAVDASAASRSPAALPVAVRTAEVIGRIWIAPYVDADGVYHEASWVRVVLQPAGWRLP